MGRGCFEQHLPRPQWTRNDMTPMDTKWFVRGCQVTSTTDSAATPQLLWCFWVSTIVPSSSAAPADLPVHGAMSATGQLPMAFGTSEYHQIPPARCHQPSFPLVTVTWDFKQHWSQKDHWHLIGVNTFVFNRFIINIYIIKKRKLMSISPYYRKAPQVIRLISSMPCWIPMLASTIDLSIGGPDSVWLKDFVFPSPLPTYCW
jgi:hypothetical protein